MKTSDLGLAGRRADVLDGGVESDKRSLSVGEIQQGFRQLLVDLRAQPRDATAATVSSTTNEKQAVMTRDAKLASGVVLVRRAVPDIDAAWITVLAAHSGAGASTVALAVADAAAAAGRAVHLMESAHPHSSGLVAASSSELGLDETGAWRRGLRGRVTIDRRARDAVPAGWPPAVDGIEPMTIVDLGLLSTGNVTRLAAGGARCIVVTRATVPGVRLTERLLDALADLPVVVAVTGPRRWPGEVTSSLGPCLRRLRADSRVVTVPIERRIEITGPAHSPLPKSVLKAGCSLLRLIDAAGRGVAAAAPRASRAKGTAR